MSILLVILLSMKKKDGHNSISKKHVSLNSRVGFIYSSNRDYTRDKSKILSIFETE